MWQKAYDAAGKQAQKTKTAAREGDGEGRYQIKNIDGRLMTVIDTQNDTRDFKAAEAYLKTLVNTEHPFSTILMDAQPVFVGKDLPGEYKSSEYTKTMKPALRKIKMQAATNLDEMLLLAENGEWRENVKPKHAKDAQNGWYRYDTEFAVPVLDAKKTVDHYTVYGGTLLIRNDADGKSYLYDLLDVEKKKVISKTSFTAETHSEVTSPKPSTDSISTSGEKVNGKFSLKAYSDVEKKQHVKDAKAFFGRTYKWAETGYITTDGARLDFSGKHEGGPGGYRTVDHRDIRDALGDDYGGDDYSGAMVQFMGEGNIRISPESGGINLSVMPTKAQMDTLSDFISKERGEVVLDLDDTNGVTLSSTEYPRGTHSSKVLNDIKAFFETGAVPQVSELGRFRYQLKNFSEQAVSTALYDALSEKATRQNQLIPVSVMPRYISEKLGIGGDIYIQRDHAYENMVSKEQAIQDGRPTQRKGENVHFHDLGVEKMTRAIMSINEPTMTISTKTKDGNPAVIMMLPEYGNNNAPLYAVLSFYSRKTISPENRETRPHVVLTIAERNFFEEGGRYGWADVIKRAINEGTVIDFNKKERSSLSEVAQSVGLGDITDASLKKNLAQFQKEVKQFRESNNIRYQLKSATELEQEVRELTKYAAYRQRGTTDREILLSAAEGSAKTEWERKRLAEYRDAVGRLEGYEARLSANRAELTGLSLADGKKNAKRISYLEDEITKDTNRVAIVENKLKDLEGNRSLQELLGRERAMLQQQERTYLGKVEELLGGYRGLYGTMRKGEKAARDIQLPKKSSEDEKISQTVRTVLEAKATPEEMVPDIETLALEGKYSYEVYSDKAAIADASRTIKRVGWAQALTDWKSAMKAGNVSKKSTAMGWALYNNAANSGDTETALDVLSDMVQHQRSAAQALQATRILKQLSPETQLYQAQRSIANLQTQLNEEYGDDKAPKLKIDQTLAEQFMKAADQAERDAVLANIYRDIGKQMPSRFKDKWNAWRYLAMLGNVRTHVRNIFGNAFFMPVVAAKDVVATGIEKAVYRLSGGKMERSKEFVTGKGGKALLQAAAQDYAKVADVAMGGGKYSDFANANKTLETQHFIGQITKRANRPPVTTYSGIAVLTLIQLFALQTQPHGRIAVDAFCRHKADNTAAVSANMGYLQPHAPLRSPCGFFASRLCFRRGHAELCLHIERILRGERQHSRLGDAQRNGAAQCPQAAFQPIHRKAVVTGRLSRQRNDRQCRVGGTDLTGAAKGQPIPVKVQDRSVVHARGSGHLQCAAQFLGIAQHRKCVLCPRNETVCVHIAAVHEPCGKLKTLFHKDELPVSHANGKCVLFLAELGQLFQIGSRDKKRLVTGTLLISLCGNNADAIAANGAQAIRSQAEVYAAQQGHIAVVRVCGKCRTAYHGRNTAELHHAFRSSDVHAWETFAAGCWYLIVRMVTG